MSKQKREMVSGEKRNTQSLDLCVLILSMPFGKLNGAKANTLGRLFAPSSEAHLGLFGGEKKSQNKNFDDHVITI